MGKFTDEMENILSGIIYVYPYEDKDCFHKKDVDTKDDTKIQKTDRTDILQLAADDFIMLASAQRDITGASDIIYEVARFVSSIRKKDGNIFPETHARLKSILVHGQKEMNRNVQMHTAEILFKQTLLLLDYGDIREVIDDIEFYKTELYRIYHYHEMGKSTGYYRQSIEKAFTIKAKNFDYVKKHMHDGIYRAKAFLLEDGMDSMSFATIPYYFEKQLIRKLDEGDENAAQFADKIEAYRQECNLLDEFYGYISSYSNDERKTALSKSKDFKALALDALGEGSEDSGIFFPVLTILCGEAAGDLSLIEKALSRYPAAYEFYGDTNDPVMGYLFEKYYDDIKSKNRTERFFRIASRLLKASVISIISAVIIYIVIKTINFDKQYGTTLLISVPLFILLTVSVAGDLLKDLTKRRRYIQHYDGVGMPRGYSVIEYDDEDKDKKKK